MKLVDNKATLSFSNGAPSMDLPIYQGSIGPDVIDIRKLYGQTGMFTYAPGFLSTASCQLQVKQIVVPQIHEAIQGLGVSAGERGATPFEELLEKQVVLEQAAAAAPAQQAQCAIVENVRGRGHGLRWCAAPSFP